MKIKNIPRKLIPLIFFSVINCSAQQFHKSVTQIKDLKLEIIKDVNLEDKLKLSLDFNDYKSINLKVEEAFYHIGLPISSEINWLLNLYYNFLKEYNELKKFKDSFGSYGFVINEKITARLYLMNFRNFKKANDYEIMLNLKINLF